MKSVKKISLAVALLVLAVSISAQSNFGIRAGLNTSSYNGVDGFDYKPGFNVGVAAQFALAPSMGIESGLYFSSLGAKLGDESVNAYYLQLPVAYYYKFNVGLDLDLYPSAGIYLGYGLTGDDDYFDYAEKFDMGATVGLTLQYSKFTIGLGYDYGFLKVFDGGDATNSNIKVSVGYFF